MHTPSAGVVIHVLLMEVKSESYDQLLRETAADAQRFGSTIDGLLRFELYGTDDRTHILLLSQWVDDVAWGKAQWDAEVQNAVVARFSSARRVDSRLYRRIVFDDESTHAASPPGTASFDI
jgi:quinol monooxygenase YgiN